MTSAPAKSAPIEYFARHHHGGRGLELLVGAMDGERTHILVFFRRSGDEAVPIEVRFTGTAPSAVEALKMLDGYPDSDEEPQRLTSRMLRTFSLGDAVSAVQSFRTGADEDLRLTGLANPSYVLRSGKELFGYRNARDLKAAMERLHAAAVYVEAIRHGQKRPAQAVKDSLSLDSLSRARTLIAGARKEGFLSSGAQGVTGGSLTDRAVEFSKALVEMNKALSRGRQNETQGGKK